MPGTTSRGYPYPTDTDPIDVAGDMQALAEAIDLDVITSNEFRRFTNKAALDAWTTAPESAMAGTADYGGAIWQKRSGTWRLVTANGWGTASLTAGVLGGNAAMGFLGGTNTDVQDQWGIRTLIPGVYQVSAQIIFSGPQSAAQQVVQGSIDLYSWANTGTPKYSISAFIAGSLGWWKLVTLNGYIGMAADEWLRVAVTGDAPTQQVDSRSRLFMTRVSGTFP